MQELWTALPFPSPVHESEKWMWSRSVLSDSSWPHGLQPTVFLHPWDFPGKSTGVGCHCLLPMTNLDSIKSQDITLPTEVHLVKAMVFPVVMYGCESWTIKKSECQRIDGFELWCWRRLLRVPWTARRSNQSILKEISPEYSLEGWCWSWNSKNLATWLEELTQWKRPLCWERLKAGGEGKDISCKEEEMVGWHHGLNGHEFEQAPRVGDGQGSLVSCSPWGLQRVRHDWVTDFL